MSAHHWIKTVADTSEPFPYSAFDYLEGKPFAELGFAGMDQSHVIDRAFINPYDAKSAGLACYGGLSDHSGILPTFAYHLRVSRRAKFVVAARRPLTTPLLTEKPEYIPGRWLYGGEMMGHHFGHFMSESSHRLYAVTEYFKELGKQGEALDGIIFPSRSPLQGFSRDLLCEYYGIPEEKIRLVTERPVVVEHLEVRPQGSILGGSALSAEYVDFLRFHQARNAKRVTTEFPKKIFFGRSHLTTGGGGIEDEHVLEQYLVENGFAVVRPEEFPLLEQLEMLRQAELIVGVGGSFVHLYDHLGSTDASMFLVSRGDPDSFYHDRTVRSKLAHLEYYQPDEERGDSVSDFKEDGRARSVTKYNMERLLDAARAHIEGGVTAASTSPAAISSSDD